MNRPKSISREAGFTMIELLTILLVALVLMLLSYPELLKYYIRGQLEGVTRQTAYVLQRAKYQAIKNSQEVQVCADTAGRAITGLGETVELPDSVSFDAPASEDATVTGDCFVFQADGSAKFLAAGTEKENDEDWRPFRFADVRGNFLEVDVRPRATARVQVRKWDETENEWFTREGGKAWEWKTGHLL